MKKSGGFEIQIDPDKKKVRFALENFGEEALSAIHGRLVQGSNDIRNEIIISMQRTPKTGRTYKKGKKFHIASSPGNPPAIDNGELLRSIQVADRKDSVEVGSRAGAPYAVFLEDKDVLNRPFLEPAITKIAPEIFRKIKRDIEGIDF